MQKIKIVFCDFEGVEVLPGGDFCPWPTEHLVQLGRAKRALHNEGIIAIDMTGRPAGYMGAALQARGILSDVWHSYEAGAVFRRMVPPGTMYHPALTNDVLTQFEAIKSHIRRIARGLGAIEEHGKAICLSLNPTGDMTVEELYHEIASRVKGMDGEKTIIIKHSKSAVDINPAGVSKGSALEFLCRGYGVDLAETAGIGDTMGDKDMLERVGLPMCVANATEDVKHLVRSRGGFVTEWEVVPGAINCLRQLCKSDETKRILDRALISCIESNKLLPTPLVSPLVWDTPDS